MRIFLVPPLLVALILSLSCAARRQAEVQHVVTDADRLLSQGDCRGALKLYRDAYRRYPEERALRNGYHAALEKVKRAAETSYEEGDYVSSGRMYFVLRQSYPAENEGIQGLSLTKQQVDERLNGCRDRSSMEALRLYRQGNLKDAIAIWKGILSFDSGNAGVRKAIETATIQMENLRKTQ